MSRLHVLHLAPADRFKTGIASYADAVDELFAKYLADDVELQRVTVDRYLAELEKSADAVVLAQIGSNEGDVFRALRQQRKLMPAVRRVIEIHDPPLLVLSYTELLERLAATLPGRVVRRVFNRLLGDYYVRSFVASTDVFVCKNEIGATALRQRFQRLGLGASVICIELPNYLDAPPAIPAGIDGERSIGFFGYIHPDKGVHVLVEAAIRLREIRGIQAVPRIVIRGSPATRQCERYIQSMKRRIRDAGLSGRVDFGGFVPFEELPDFVAGLTALALPYMIESRSSASGPLLWARTCGVPVLAHRTAVFESSVRDGVDGVLVGIGNLEEWTEVMERLAAQPDWAEKFRPGTEARKAHASWTAIAARFRTALGLRQAAVS